MLEYFKKTLISANREKQDFARFVRKACKGNFLKLQFLEMPNHSCFEQAFKNIEVHENVFCAMFWNFMTGGFAMKKFITIGREFGSGGTEIGELVAKELGIPFYDSVIIDMSAKTSGLSPDFIKQNEQNLTSGWLYTLLLGSSYSSLQNPGVPLADQVFNAQRKTIVELAKKGPCVIVGRCSDYVLRHCEDISRDDLLSVFIYAPLEDKVKYAIEKKGFEKNTAERDVKLIDKRRANHYNTFTERTWGNKTHYDLLVNSSLLGYENTAKMIAQIARTL